MTDDIRHSDSDSDSDSDSPIRSRTVAWVIGGIFLASMLVFGFFWLFALAMMFYE